MSLTLSSMKKNKKTNVNIILFVIYYLSLFSVDDTENHFGGFLKKVKDRESDTVNVRLLL